MSTTTQEIRQAIYEKVVEDAEKQAALKIARQLLTCLDVVTISESTGLPFEEVEALYDEEKKGRVLNMSHHQPRLQKNLANIVRIFGQDVYDHIALAEPKLAKSVDYAMGFTDGADMIERKIALRLLDDFSFERVSYILDIPVAKLSDMAHDHAATPPIDLDLPF